MRVALLALAAQFAAALPAGAQGNPQPAAQNPSPMTESTRRHARVPQYEADGIRVSISGVMSQPADVFLARSKVRSPRIDILVHFHGPAFIVNRAKVLGALHHSFTKMGVGEADFHALGCAPRRM